MRHYLKYALLLSMVAVFALPAFAQDETPEATTGGSSISIGDTVTGELTEDAPRLSYTLEAEDDAVVNISLSSEIFDTYL